MGRCQIKLLKKLMNIDLLPRSTHTQKGTYPKGPNSLRASFETDLFLGRWRPHLQIYGQHHDRLKHSERVVFFFSIFIPTNWGNDPIWRFVFFRWVAQRPISLLDGKIKLHDCKTSSKVCPTKWIDLETFKCCRVFFSIGGFTCHFLNHDYTGVRTSLTWWSTIISKKTKTCRFSNWFWSKWPFLTLIFCFPAYSSRMSCRNKNIQIDLCRCSTFCRKAWLLWIATCHETNFWVAWILVIVGELVSWDFTVELEWHCFQESSIIICFICIQYILYIH